MKKLLSLSVFLYCTFSIAAFLPPRPKRFRSHEDAERNFRSPAAILATGSASLRTVANAPLYSWPVKVISIGHTIASYQNYSGSAADAYFHHGLDIRADAGSDVIAAVGGKVVNIQNYMTGDAYWEIAILDDEGYVWQYHHVDHDSIPKGIQDAFKSGTKIATGTKLGEVFYWPAVTFGERYHHVHLNVIGAKQAYMDPFQFLLPLADSAAPQVKDIYLMQNAKRVSGTTVTGKYTIAAEVSDLILHDKFTVPPSAIFYEMDGMMPVMVWQFNNLPGGSSNTQFVNEFFIGNTCGNYTCRRAVIDLGFQKKPVRTFPTTPGKHHLVLRLSDYSGNTAEKSFDWTVN